jgi:hypothetical protein
VKNTHLQVFLVILTSAVVVIALILTGCTTAPVSNGTVASPEPVTSLASNPVPVSPTDNISDSTSDKPGQEGVKVHGHWTIEVINPDGSPAEKREFENAYYAAGTSLPNILGRQYSVGGWEVELAGTVNAHIGESGFAIEGPTYFNTLTVEVIAGQLRLHGTAIAEHDGNILAVSTHLNELNPSIAPAPLYKMGTPVILFTGTDLSTPLPLITGQQVLVTVVISFS